VPGYKVRTMALPQGLWPKNRPLAWQGSWTDKKSGRTIRYAHDGVLKVAGSAAPSPFTAAFDTHSMPRVQVIGNAIEKTLDRLEATHERFVVGSAKP
jgi:hypothetical protein